MLQITKLICYKSSHRRRCTLPLYTCPLAEYMHAQSHTRAHARTPEHMRVHMHRHASSRICTCALVCMHASVHTCRFSATQCSTALFATDGRWHCQFVAQKSNFCGWRRGSNPRTSTPTYTQSSIVVLPRAGSDHCWRADEVL